ncbi:MAG: hypothetical protein KatS3mg129_3210 [Leptospiraceae bacterium]|nr:MAG: hypothetical protein KatS3mg129_3210 [Leptospiraceae bacterium]
MLSKRRNLLLIIVFYFFITILLKSSINAQTKINPELYLTLILNFGSVNTVSFSSDGKFFASGSWDYTIKLYAMPFSKFRGSIK